MDKLHFCLSDAHDEGDQDMLGILVPHPSGVVYEQQACGIRCTHPSLEGFYLPLPIEAFPHDTLEDEGAGRYQTDLTEMLLTSNYLLFAYFRPLTVDEQAQNPELCQQFGEAWVPLVVRDTPGQVDTCYLIDDLLEPLRGRVVVLTYPNSD